MTHHEELLDHLAAQATAAAAAAASAAGVPSRSMHCLGVLANLTEGCLKCRSYIKARRTASELHRALTQLMAGPGALCIMLSLRCLVNLVLHEPLGETLFA